MKYLSIIFLLITTLSLNAEVITDGTLGQNTNLSGPNFQITSDLGQQHGSNLFHSFQDFNLNSLESATFSGPNNIQNILSRVTGGNPSNIDGLIRSTIPNADFYFLNPYGIMFGSNARLDVQGSFHASTADYLRLRGNGRFDARNINDSLLTVSPVEAFGFLTDSPSSITTQDSNLSVYEGKTLSLIGGDLELNGESAIQFNELGTMAIFSHSKLATSSGRINLASVASKGTVTSNESGLELNAVGGTITVDKTFIDVSGKGGGQVFIRGGQLIMRDAVIQANTMAAQNGKVINLQLTESINISGELQTILSKSFGKGNAGNVVIATPNLEIIGSSHILTNNFAQGDGGNIDINAQQIKMVDGATIICASYGSGQCGDLNIKATKSISLLGASKGNYIRAGLPFIKQPTTISTTAHHGVGGQLNVESDQIDMIGSIISTSSLGVGNSGDVRINAGTLNATDGSLITSSGLSSGQAGNIDINVKNTLSLSRRRVGSFITPTGIKFENNRSNISSFGMIGKGGNISISAQTFKIDKEGFISASILGRVTAETSGKITIKTDNLSISQGGLINNSNGIFLGGKFHVGAGHGGSIEIQAKNIDIDVDQSDLPTGIFSNTYSKSNGGDIKIQTDSLNVINDGTISARSNATGNSGSIAIQADIIKLTNQGKISTEAKNAVGGNIVVKTPNLLYLHKAAIITSVGTGEGKGGDITITSPVFVVMDGGIIKAQADVGHGGNINIESEQFITSPDSLISASSRLGIDGEVKIESPNVDMESFLVILSDDAVDASRLIQKPCRMRGGSFFVQKINGSPQTPYDYQPSTYLPETNGEVTKISMNPEKKIALSTCKNF